MTRYRGTYDPFALYSPKEMRTTHADPLLLAIVKAWAAERGLTGNLLAIITGRNANDDVTLHFYPPRNQVKASKAALLQYIAANRHAYQRPKVVKTYPDKPFPPTEHWTMWHGGTFPYPEDTIVKVLWRNVDRNPAIGPASTFDFDWYVGEERPEDIMSFHVEDNQEPNQ